ncbi:hypothetical protein LTR47_011929 [Exophiala xenobiotica]|nr:hypothetical protein LTR47_011929 [Exophiala xenobiotica]KAK5344256.1 hypothetical protein LTR61_011975 [Exophiala xenobiotica]
MSPIFNAPHSRGNSVIPSPTISRAQLGMPTKTHFRSSSAPSMDDNVTNRSGYLVNPHLPVYAAHNQQGPSSSLFATNCIPYRNVAMPEPPLINLEDAFDSQIDLNSKTQSCSMSPSPVLAPASTTSILSYLTQPTQPITLVRHLTYQTGRALSGLPQGRVVGLVRSFDRWNTGMRREGPSRGVKYLRTLAHLVIITEIELVCPYFGFLEIEEAIETKNFVSKEGNLTGSGNVTLTVSLALYYLLMLAKATPLPDQPFSYMEVGGSGTLSRQRVWDGGHGTGDGTTTDDEDDDSDELGKDGKDKWIPEPQMGEKREARTVRGWVWPSDPWHKREGERGGRGGGRGRERCRKRKKEAVYYA